MSVLHSYTFEHKLLEFGVADDQKLTKFNGEG